MFFFTLFDIAWYRDPTQQSTKKYNKRDKENVLFELEIKKKLDGAMFCVVVGRWTIFPFTLGSVDAIFLTQNGSRISGVGKSQKLFTRKIFTAAIVAQRMLPYI